MNKFFALVFLWKETKNILGNLKDTTFEHIPLKQQKVLQQERGYGRNQGWKDMNKFKIGINATILAVITDAICLYCFYNAWAWGNFEFVRNLIYNIFLLPAIFICEYLLRLNPDMGILSFILFFQFYLIFWIIIKLKNCYRKHDTKSETT